MNPLTGADRMRAYDYRGIAFDLRLTGPGIAFDLRLSSGQVGRHVNPKTHQQTKFGEVF